MSVSNQFNKWLKEVMRSDLGRTDDLPTAVQQHLFSVYESFAKAYLGWLRIQEQKPDTWFPARPVLDEGLISEMGYFFSDHQHLVRGVKCMRSKINHLQRL